jgi:hypothetical protein
MNQNPDEYDIEKETAVCHQMLATRIPLRVSGIYRHLTENCQTLEPWQRKVMVDLLRCIERNCEELLETIGKERLPAVAWIARNLLELWVWVKYCGISKDNARRFHEDALRDMKGLSETYSKICNAHGMEDGTHHIRSAKIKALGSKMLGLDDIDRRFLNVKEAAKAPGVDMDDRFETFNPFFSKFAHPTAGLIHGILHQAKNCQRMQAVITTQGVYFAAQSTLAIEAHLGIAPTEE